MSGHAIEGVPPAPREPFFSEPTEQPAARRSSLWTRRPLADVQQVDARKSHKTAQERQGQASWEYHLRVRHYIDNKQLDSHGHYPVQGEKDGRQARAYLRDACVICKHAEGGETSEPDEHEELPSPRP